MSAQEEINKQSLKLREVTDFLQFFLKIMAVKSKNFARSLWTLENSCSYTNFLISKLHNER